MRKKITVVGAGNVGATCAQELARRDYADVVLVDIIPNFGITFIVDSTTIICCVVCEYTVIYS
jgi:malate/lactate dehydrogenase